VVRLLEQEGAVVKAWEPFSPKSDLPGITAAESLEAALSDADAIVLLVAHSEFVGLKAADLAGKTKCRIIVDTVNAWNTPDWRNSEFQIPRLGVGT